MGIVKYLFMMVAGVTILFCTITCGGKEIPEFDQNKAFEYLKKQCDFGPRNPGSEGHSTCLEFLTTELQKYADNVSFQQFQFTFGPDRKSALGTNIIANFGGQKGQRILLCAHWDTRPWADYDPDLNKRSLPILGASDGASGVAVLLEVARLLHEYEPKYGVDIVLFDAEDSGEGGNDRSWALGSREFAKKKDPRYNPSYGLLLDLIGDADLQLYIERNSQDYAPDIVKKVWNRAAQLGISEFIPVPRHRMTDDHIPLLEVGIQCIDIIDFDYQYWHTTEDTPDKCSAASLGKVGRVVVSLLYD